MPGAFEFSVYNSSILLAARLSSNLRSSLRHGGGVVFGMSMIGTLIPDAFTDLRCIIVATALPVYGTYAHLLLHTLALPGGGTVGCAFIRTLGGCALLAFVISALHRR